MKLKDAWYQERTKMDQVISDRDQENEDLRKRRRKVKVTGTTLITCPTKTYIIIIQTMKRLHL
jgi:hypothetical protein